MNNFYLICAFLIFLPLNVIHASNLVNDCPVTLEVIRKDYITMAGRNSTPSDPYSIILRPIKQIGYIEKCNSLANVKNFHMNNAGSQNVFKSLDIGDIVSGTINYHRPSPFGKMLNENFHYGFRLNKLTSQNKGNKTFDNNSYIYFRHIGLYE